MPLGSQAAAGARLALVIVAAASFGVVMVRHRSRPFLSCRQVWVAAAVMLAVAVAVPPQGSADLWSYAAYGRIVAHYHHSPYRTAPDDVGADPITARVAQAWKETPSVYGPAFVAVAAAGSVMAGTSPLANRLFFQGLAAVAVLASLALLSRRESDPGGLALLALNPAVALAVVNGGHNDILVGLGVLAAVILASDGRPRAAAGVLGLAALVKIVALLPLVALVVWVLRRRGWRPSLAASGVGLGVVAVGYALVGGRSALDPVLALGDAHSRASIWSLLGRIDPVLGDPLVSGTMLVLAVGLVVVGMSRAPLDLLMGTVLVAYLVGAPYVLPWYVAWSLPVLALAWRSSAAVITASAALGLVVSYVGAPHLRSPLLRTLVHPFFSVVMPIALASSLVYLVVCARRRSFLDDAGEGIMRSSRRILPSGPSR